MLVRDANMFWEVQDIIRGNPHIQKPSAFYRYLGRTYLSHALAGLRRQIKPHRDSISFVGLLDEIAENPIKTEAPVISRLLMTGASVMHIGLCTSGVEDYSKS